MARAFPGKTKLEDLLFDAVWLRQIMDYVLYPAFAGAQVKSR